MITGDELARKAGSDGGQTTLLILPSPARAGHPTEGRGVLAIGVRLVLVVDPNARTISARRQHGVVSLYGERDAVPCDEAIPGFSLPVAAVFEM